MEKSLDPNVTKKMFCYNERNCKKSERVIERSHFFVENLDLSILLRCILRCHFPGRPSEDNMKGIIVQGLDLSRDYSNNGWDI